jgi:hypothetical protein
MEIDEEIFTLKKISKEDQEKLKKNILLIGNFKQVI